MRLIDADALPIHKAWCVDEAGWGATFYVADKEDIDNAPTIEAETVKHGRWEKHPAAHGFERCSVCHDCYIWGEWADGKKWNYCPNCGAKMDEEDNDAAD